MTAKTSNHAVRGRNLRGDSMPPSEKFSVARIANLAKLEVPDDQLATARVDLENILQFIQVLDELKLDDVEPFFGAVTGDSPAYSPVRDDQTDASIERDRILQNAANHDCEFYLVPPVFD